jgi:hypothetical protein
VSGPYIVGSAFILHSVNLLVGTVESGKGRGADWTTGARVSAGF